MAIPITSIRDFREKFEESKHHSDLFAYFLFDDRMSHEAIEKFARAEFNWLDEMAYAARMFFFIFVRPDFENYGKAVNPSPEVGRMFGILPNQLPGVVLFTLAADGEGVSDGVYLPLDAKLFKEEVWRVEEIFSELFSIIQDCRKGAKEPAHLLKKIESEIARLRREESMKPIWSYFKDNLISLLNFPKAILDATSKAIAESLAKKVVGG